MNNKTELSDRMKVYEKDNSHRFKNIDEYPVIARIDGRGFSKFTKSFDKPFDKDFANCMLETTIALMKETNAKIAYYQSDEISLVFFQENSTSQIWFNGKQQKMASVLASMAGTVFYKKVLELAPEKLGDKIPMFDCRVFQVPSKEEASNYLIWREKDAVRNSISNFARSFFSTKQLEGVGTVERMKMLGSINKDWGACLPVFKHGVFVRSHIIEVSLSKENLDLLPPKHNARINPEAAIHRHEVLKLDMPKLIDIKNREGVIFDGENPIEKEHYERK